MFLHSFDRSYDLTLVHEISIRTTLLIDLVIPATVWDDPPFRTAIKLAEFQKRSISLIINIISNHKISALKYSAIEN